MKKILPLAALVVLTAYFLWLLSTGDGGRAAMPQTENDVQAREAAELVEPRAPGSTDDAATPARSEVALEREATEPAPDSVTEPANEKVDRERKDTFVVIVVDEFGAPIPGALVRARGTRTTVNSGDWHGWVGPDSSDKTDLSGEAELVVPHWLGSGGSWLEVFKVCYQIQHDDYVTVDVESEVDESPVTVVLERGAFLIVSGWVESERERVTDVTPSLSHDVDVGAEDWIPIGDGRPSCNKVAPGKHAIYLTHVRQGGTWHSDVTDFELAPGEQKELHLQLHPPRTLSGRLDERVPRPIVNGEVELDLYYQGQPYGVDLLRTYKVSVESDGTFEVPNLPPGAGEMIAMCDGWVSVQDPVLEPDQTEPGDDPEYRLQQFSANPERELVVRMEPTASAEFTVLDPGGEPLEGATIYLSPNVHWEPGYAQLFLDRRWKATTDARGIALLENLPPAEDDSVAVRHPLYRMPLAEGSWGQTRRYVWVDLVSGETTRRTIQLEESTDN